jgi:hypothetical protein
MRIVFGDAGSWQRTWDHSNTRQKISKGGWECLFLPPYKVLTNSSKAEVAHLVERDLAKVEVAGSSPVFRSHLRSALGGKAQADLIPPARKSGDFF